MGEDKSVRKLRLQLEAALGKQREEQAIELLQELVRIDSKTPRWPHKLGDLQRKRHQRSEAIEAYSIAADLYHAQGFLARAIAMAKTVLELDPRQTQVLERIDPAGARMLQMRPETPGEGAGGAPPRIRHPAINSEIAALRHPAIMPEEAPDSLLQQPIRPASTAKQPAVSPRMPPPVPGRRHAEPPPGPAVGLVEAVADPAPAPPEPDAEEEIVVLFSDTPAESAVKIGLTELELAPRQPVDPGGVSAPKLNARALANLPLFALFADVPPAALSEMIRQASLIELADAAPVFRKGDPADALYGIVEGSVEVVLPDPARKIMLAEGDVFGEACLLAGEQRHSDVIVRGRLLALRFPSDGLTQLAAAHPRLAEVLLELLARRLLGNLLQSSPLFQEFTGASRQDLIAQFEIRRATEDTILAECGKLSDGLYVNLTGAIEVVYGDGRPTERYPAGTMFGQASLLTRHPSEIRVKALSNLLLLRLPTRGFQAIAMQYPSLLAHLSELADASVAALGS